MDCLSPSVSTSAASRPPQQPFGSQISLCFRQTEPSVSPLKPCVKSIINPSAHMQQNTPQFSIQTERPLEPLPLHCSLLFPQGPRTRPSVPPGIFFDPYYPSMQQLSISHAPYRFTQAGVLGLVAGSSSRGFIGACHC